MSTLLTLLVLLALFIVYKGCIIVEQQEVVIIQRLGKYKETLSAGLNFIVPFICLVPLFLIVHCLPLL